MTEASHLEKLCRRLAKEKHVALNQCDSDSINPTVDEKHTQLIKKIPEFHVLHNPVLVLEGETATDKIIYASASSIEVSEDGYAAGFFMLDDKLKGIKIVVNEADGDGTMIFNSYDPKLREDVTIMPTNLGTMSNIHKYKFGPAKRADYNGVEKMIYLYQNHPIFSSKKINN